MSAYIEVSWVAGRYEGVGVKNDNVWVCDNMCEWVRICWLV